MTLIEDMVITCTGFHLEKFSWEGGEVTEFNLFNGQGHSNYLN